MNANFNCVCAVTLPHLAPSFWRPGATSGPYITSPVPDTITSEWVGTQQILVNNDSVKCKSRVLWLMSL